VAHWYPVDGQQRVEVVGEAGEGRRVLPTVGVDEPVRGRSGRVQRRRVAHRIDVRQYLTGGLVGQLGTDVAQPVKP
jgi:hypothetical protein